MQIRPGQTGELTHTKPIQSAGRTPAQVTAPVSSSALPFAAHQLELGTGSTGRGTGPLTFLDEAEAEPSPALQAEAQIWYSICLGNNSKLC